MLATQIFTENNTKFSSEQVISNSIFLKKKQRSVWETQRCPCPPIRRHCRSDGSGVVFTWEHPVSLTAYVMPTQFLKMTRLLPSPTWRNYAKTEQTARVAKPNGGWWHHFDLLVTLDVSRWLSSRPCRTEVFGRAVSTRRTVIGCRWLNQARACWPGSAFGVPTSWRCWTPCPTASSRTRKWLKRKPPFLFHRHQGIFLLLNERVGRSFISDADTHQSYSWICLSPFCLPISTADISCLTNCPWCDVFTSSPSAPLKHNFLRAQSH